MPCICVRLKDPAIKQAVLSEILKLDPLAVVERDLNPTAFIVDINTAYWELDKLEGVSDAFLEREACSCDSGERRDELVDARGIFCCYYCSKCEEEKRSQYRVEVLEDSSYEANEPIETDY